MSSLELGVSGEATGFSAFIVADIAIYREGLRTYFESQPSCVVVGSASSFGEVKGNETDVLIVDCTNRPPSAILSAHGVVTSSGAALVAIGIPDNLNVLLAYIEAGAVACVGTDDTLEELYKTAQHVAIEGSSVTGMLMEAVVARLQERALRDHGKTMTYRALTAREFQVAELMGESLSNKEIACELDISLNTVKNHAHQVIQKLGISRRSETDRVLARISGAAQDATI